MSGSQKDLIKVDRSMVLPIVVEPMIVSSNLVDWAGPNRDLVDMLLLEGGGILFRNFIVNGVNDFERFIATVSRELVGYQDRATPRSVVSGNIYTATDYPANYSIFLHNESSFAYSWPTKIFFFCVTQPREGGETPLADVHKVFERIDPMIRERFIRKGVMYVRNFGAGMGLSWETVFQTTNRAVMEEYCSKSEIECEWRGGNRLRTRQVRPAVLAHPRTGKMLWFNHATVLHVSTLESKRREMLLRMFKEEDLPNNTYYGDASPIEPSVLDALRDAYEAETKMFSWQEGDVLMLDNLSVAHGRRPFVGPRKVVTGMADPMSWGGVLQTTQEAPR